MDLRKVISIAELLLSFFYLILWVKNIGTRSLDFFYVAFFFGMFVSDIIWFAFPVKEKR